ncbi:oligosaccharide flippase family protein [Enterobacteriaceae bacterium H11S18]|uniref:oligosaccharide flippase family protein n=1 Tax=Dryocola clanedunensis TaxID=2925396 RepID=UPI0022EFE729|nr:oligosaccharide flippase family protein [Dryocola clanedunensis]MCT4712313.1 oligosaccharide flippase family protein [Dryocola clanedunensis]
MASLKKNISSLVLVQLISYVVPLLQIPYLTRILGVDFFGIYAYSLVLIQFANLIVDFGFNLYFPQLVAGGRKKSQEIGRLVYSCCIIKTIILMPVLLAMVFLVNTNQVYSQHILFFTISFVMIIANAFTFIWLFQGLEKLYIYSRIAIVSKLLSLLFIFIVIKSPSDINKLAVINATQQIFVMAVFIYWALKVVRIRPVRVGLRYLKVIAAKSFEFFFSRAFVAIYTSGCGLLIGNLGSPAQMALYSTAEQLYKAAQQVFSPVSQALYPYMMRTKDYRVFYRLLIGCLVICMIGCMVGWVWGNEIIKLLYGEAFEPATNILNVLLFALIFNTMAVMLGYPALAPLGLSKVANKSVIYAGIVQLILFLIIALTSTNRLPINVAYSVLASESIVMLIRLTALKGKK